jgi:hypothetical protein
VIRLPLPVARRSRQPYAVGGLDFPPPIIPVSVFGPAGAVTVDAVLDSGGVCGLFAEWVAWRVGLRRQPGSPVITMGSSVTVTGFPTWFGRIDMQINDPTGIASPLRWDAVVGFTPRGSFGGPVSGVIGVNGGLGRFRRVEFDWSAPGGPEVVIRP